ncbi:16S rRNA (guanine(527)-N(7))-methyltransferase RsmG [Bifidobacterium avesanii]|uniref:Ribosomal RNA small subunit methyltransferase G n=1 Tax=Bifidobacterium avesanii TaxID=1798157 RepID=A0A7K3TIW1_9BIFI|nr:16S rRNA (guanine(527)-N(7))-methyltransferase RsmG [Bifidobacterium avesanii]NEG78629.1 16S rRNA (guanine(527)-N(7))-methyltransferase RsmG [Bifidobacterium avesanii]
MTDELEGSPVVREVLGDAYEPLARFHAKLMAEGEPRGLIGPRDVPIVWERHILNSAAIVPFVRDAVSGFSRKNVADIGSGGGFPGLIVAACLPDVSVTLVEPMERRVEWLGECVELMGLENVTIRRARSEELIAQMTAASGAGAGGRRGGSRRQRGGRGGRGGRRDGRDAQQVVENNSQLTGDGAPDRFAAVTCRAVAPMTKLSGWTLPLLTPGGRLVALKGRSAQAEIEKAAKEISKAHGLNPRVVEAPVGPGLEPTHVVLVDKR